MGWMVVLALLSSSCQAALAFSSHFDSDGALLSELSWPSSLAVVAVSFSGLITIIFLMLACLCCKKGDIGFKELDNVEGEDYTTEFSIQSSPAAQNGTEVYVLPLTEVSVPMSKQPGRSVQLLKSTELGRRSLLYLKEIGRGWFGKVLLGEVNAGLASTQVMVRELKVSASVQEQMLFLEEAQPYRVLQHHNLLQCLAQCTEITPYLLVMEFCPLGDVKGYLQSCAAPDPLTLQRMSCELCCGLLHLHKSGYTHSDLALRNCLLAADLTVKIGDYGLAHSKYRDDYLVTCDQLWVPLRWIAPELIDEVHGNLLVVDQTKASNIWSLGVALWELLESGRQPYDSYSDRQVLSYVIKEQQLKLPKPQLKQLHSDRWYEVMQFCWLQPEQRPTVDEVHLLLTYLSVKGSSELEEEFEKRWNSMKPNSLTDGGGHHEPELSSYPLLERFSSDGFQSDDVLTVTQTSQGLNFEYKWERGRHEQYPPSPGRQSRRDPYHATGSGDRLSLGASPSGYDGKVGGSNSRPPEPVPVLSGRSPSATGDYFIRIEEPSDGTLEQDYSPPEVEGEERPRADRPSVSVSAEPLPERAVSSAEDPENSTPNGRSTLPSATSPQEESPPDRDGTSRFDDPLGASASLDRPGRRHFKADAAEEPVPSETEDQEDATVIQREEAERGTFPRAAGAQFATRWASNVSSNNNVSSEPREQVGTWRNRRSEDSQDGDAQPYGPESWQIADPGEGDAAVSATGGEDRYYDAREFEKFSAATERCRATEDSIRPSRSSVCDSEETASETYRTSPESERATSAPEMDPLGVRFIEPSTLDLEIPRDPDIDTFSSAISLQSSSDERRGDSSPGTATESPEKSPSKDFYQTSDDEDATESTSGDFTDPRRERSDAAPSFRSLQKRVGTPDSLDSLDTPSTASSSDASSLGNYAPSARHKAPDSGYDTENYESPEFVLKDPQEGKEADGRYQPNPSQERSLESGDLPISRSVSGDLQGLDAKNPYRDSAYFSDYDSFNREEEEEEEEGERSEEKEPKDEPRPDVRLESTSDSTAAEALVDGAEVQTKRSSLPASEASSLRTPLVVREESVDEGLGLECHKDSVPEKEGHPDSAVKPASCRTFTPSPVQLCLIKTCAAKPRSPASVTLTAGLQAEDEPRSARESLGTPHAPKCVSPPLVRKENRAGDSAEDEESEDSDESDEELRSYDIQEHGEESEEENPAVPVVIVDNSAAVHLRSLLKTPNSSPRTVPEDSDRKKKAVSFYDDVTVYLFDQESPTLEPAEQEFPDVVPPTLPEERQIAFKESNNHHLGLAGGGSFEWDGEMAIKAVKTSFITSLSPAIRSTEASAPPAPVPKLVAPVQLSRFSVSPTSLSRFSITQVADNTIGPLEEKVQSRQEM